MPRFALCSGLLIAAILTIGGAAQAQYAGPGTIRPPASLTDLLKQPIDGQPVKLRGRLLQQLNQDKYLFSDGKSQIRVEIESEVFPKQQIDDKTEIEIVGKVEKDFMETPEIDVKRVDVIAPPPPPQIIKQR